jgi:hypothetical protein
MKKTLLTMAALMAAAPACAAPVVDTFSISASAFPAGAPSQVVTGQFTVAFDDAASVAPTRTGLSVSGFTFSGYDLQYVFSKSRDWLTVGTNLLSSGGCSVAGNANQFCFIISNASTKFTPNGNLSYSVSTSSTAYASVFTVNRVTAAVPEPAAWAMMILGMGVVGAAMRRRPIRTLYAG